MVHTTGSTNKALHSLQVEFRHTFIGFHQFPEIQAATNDDDDSNT
jgi:hypothetical protein